MEKIRKIDPDFDAAKNVKMFGSTKRAEWLEQSFVESLASIALKASFNAASQDVEARNEKIPPFKVE